MTSPSGGYKVSIELAAKVNDYVRGMDSAARVTRNLRDAQQGTARSSAELAASLTATGEAARRSAADLSAAARSTNSLARNTNRLGDAEERLNRIRRGAPPAPPTPNPPPRPSGSSSPPGGDKGGSMAALAAVGALGALGSAGGALNAVPAVLTATGTAAAALPGLVGGAVIATNTLKLSLLGLGEAAGEVFNEDDPFKRLAPSARSLISQLQVLKPALLDYQAGLQDRALKGTTAGLNLLATRTLPQVSGSVNALADNWANAFAEITLAVSDPGTVDAFNTIAGSADRLFDQIATRIRPAAQAISTLAVAADPVAQAVGEKLVGAIDAFTTKVEQAKQSGSLDAFFAAGAESAAEMAQVGGDVLRITGQLIAELTKQDAATGNIAASLSSYVQSGRSAQDIAGIVRTLTTAYEGMAQVVGPLGALIRDALASPGTADSVQQLMTILSAGTQVLATVAQLFLDINEATGGIAVTLVGLGIVFTKTSALIGAMGVAAATASARLAGMGGAGATAGRGLTGLAGGAGKALGALVALQIAGQVFDQFGPAAANVDGLSDSIERYARTGALTDEVTRVFGDGLKDMADSAFYASQDGILGGLGRTIENLLPPVKNLNEAITGNSFTGDQNKYAALDQALSQYATNTRDRAGAQKFFTKALQESGLSVDEFTALVPQSARALKELHTEAETGAGSVEALAERTKLLNAPLAETVTLGRDVIGIFTELNGGAIGFAEAQIAAEGAVDALRAGLKENGLALTQNGAAFDIVNEKGAKNLQLTLDLAKKAADAAQKKLDESGSTEQAAAVYDQYIERLRTSLALMGASPKFIDAVIGKYAAMPAALNAAADASNTLNGSLKSIPKGTTFTFNGESIVDGTGKALTLKNGIKDLPVGKTFKFDGKSLVDGKGKAYALDQQVRNIKDRADIKVTIDDKGVVARLDKLSVYQQALKKGMSPYFQGPVLGSDGRGYAGGGWTGPGGKFEPAGIVHADEFVIQKDSRRKIEARAPGLLDQMNRHGRLPGEYVPDEGYASGGRVGWPYPVNANVTRIPSKQEVASAVAPYLPMGGGATAPFIVNLIKQQFPGVNIVSVFRKGSRTLSGNLSLHAQNRAVDTAPDKGLAAFFYNNYKGRLREHITPWQQYNVLRGKDHTYTGAVWNQHNFPGGNAHNHIAMAKGGVIREPVFGVGVSGKTYSLAENGPETVIPGYARGGRVGSLVNVEAPDPVDKPERGTRLDSVEAYIAARNAVQSLSLSLRENGRDLRLNSRDGIENRSVLNAGIRAAQEAAKAKFDETGSVRKANAEYQKHLRSLRAVLVQQKINSVTARNLVNGVAGPVDYDLPTVAPKPLANSQGNIAFIRSAAGAVEGLGKLQDTLSLNKPGVNIQTAEGRENLLSIIDFLEGAGRVAQDKFSQTGSAKSAKLVYQTLVRQLRGSLAEAGYSKKLIDQLVNNYGKITLQRNAEGGVYGGLTQSTAYGPGNTLYAFREPSTGGEAFVARNGARERSERVLAIAAGWHGGRYVSSQGASGGAASHSSSLVVNNYGDRMSDGDLQRAQRRLDAKARVGRPR